MGWVVQVPSHHLSSLRFPQRQAPPSFTEEARSVDLGCCSRVAFPGPPGALSNHRHAEMGGLGVSEIGLACDLLSEIGLTTLCVHQPEEVELFSNYSFRLSNPVIG